MIDVLQELEHHRLDPSKLTLDNLTDSLPSYFKSESDAIYRWVAIPYLQGWSIVVYLCRDEKRTIHHQFMYADLKTSLCHMLLWFLDNDIISYHQIIELL